ncbi:MAG: excinuclease ATPase subunit [Oscillospiraceae bacterium]|nr:excinuclease ATPase subunit [Oscillospiraceae bacterium]
MSWGPCFMYYRCPDCGKQFKCAVDMIPVLGDDFGKCPVCGAAGVFVKEGARTPDDQDYEEVGE